jgi:hypothetical protein
VFVDPDNGLRHDARAVPSYRNDAEKHVYLSEVGKLVGRGRAWWCHTTRRLPNRFAGRRWQMDDVRDALGVEPLAVCGRLATRHDCSS